jgi:RNA polymerase sigma-70 factor (ECF subfamily)
MENAVTGSTDRGDRADVVLEQNELYQTLQAALKKIPKKHRVAFTLREIEGFSYAEIAEMVSCSIGTVKSRLFHARLKLRRYLEPYLRESGSNSSASPRSRGGKR